MDIVQMFNAAAEWISNPINQMVVGLTAPVVGSAIAMLAIRHHDNKARAEAGKPSAP
ncbi:MAG TPA: hypothetical protein VL625_08150 [Patescibacteria group bacterium]|jgi:hypothetical protein|nr:hypothetical protein [Patescibacteria group bacterium]